MSNNKKTKFQKYLDKQNSMYSQEVTKMSDEVRLSYTKKFFGKILKNFHEVDSEYGMRIFNGLSEDGNCVVTEQGGLFCEATGFKGNPVEFILSQENLTSYGAYRRYFTSIIRTINRLEGEDHDALEKDPLIDKINSFRCRPHFAEKLEPFGLDMEDVVKHPFWFDGYQRFYYVYLNRLKSPLCKHQWRFDGDSYHESIFGVPELIEFPHADQIFFVENPMQLVSMSETISAPVYVRPDAISYLYHDYSNLIRGKQVVCIKAKNQRNADPANFDLTYLESDDPLELLWVYEQGEPKEGDLSEELLRSMNADMMDTASASINSFLKKKGIS